MLGPLRLAITIAIGNCFALHDVAGGEVTRVNVLVDTGGSRSGVYIDYCGSGADLLLSGFNGRFVGLVRIAPGGPRDVW